MNTINIGIFAHVDAGKTTITENILYESGAINKIGRVDDGNTQTDGMDIERRRGISIKATPTSVFINDLKINIIDTPGHSDFISEVERSMMPLDGAVLVVSAKEGIQPSTRLLFRSLVKLKIPMIIFINKIDRPGADPGRLASEMRNELSDAIFPIQTVSISGGGNIDISGLFSFDAQDAVNSLSAVNDEFISTWLGEQNLPKEKLTDEIAACSRKGLLYPLLYGSALKSLGVDYLLDAIGLLLPVNSDRCDRELSGVVFKVTRERVARKGAKLVFLRLYGGSLHVRQTVGAETVTGIMNFTNGRTAFTGQLFAGDIGVVTGLNSLKVGDTIGNCPEARRIVLGKPTLKANLMPEKAAELIRLAEAVKEIAEGDPFLEFELDETGRELYINLFGKVQMEVLKETLLSHYGIAAEFGEEVLIYRETVSGSGESRIKMYTAQNPWVATVGIKVEPNTAGSGNEFRSDVSAAAVPEKFQAGVRDGVFQALKQGLYGWELDDTIVTLTEADFDTGSTRGDFRDLTPMVVMEAVDRAKTKLLWPLYSFELTVPEDLLGRAFSDLAKMRATFAEPVSKNGFSCITGTVPAELSRNYDLEVISYSGARGSYTFKFHSYGDVPAGFVKKRKKMYADPLNKSLYLMSKSRAI